MTSETYKEKGGYNQISCKYNHGVVKKLSCNRAGACDKCAWNKGNEVAKKRLKELYGYEQ